MNTFTTILLPIFLLTGFCAASLAFYGRFQTLPGFLTGPNICKLEAGGCQALFRSPRAALWGIPNSILGLAYYPLLGIGMASEWPKWMLLSAACMALVMSVQLASILIRDKLECRICWMGHASNLAVWLMLLLSMN